MHTKWERVFAYALLSLLFGNSCAQIGSNCTFITICLARHATCDHNNICRCKPDYPVQISERRCAKVRRHLEACTHTRECSKLDANMYCSRTSSQSRCECFDDYAYNKATKSCQPHTPPTPKPDRPLGACEHYEARCQNGKCVPRKYLCDGDYDCEDGSDENNCARPSLCEPNEMQCDNKKCILKVYLCDGDDDCGDGTDEKSCRENIPGSPCLMGQYQCLSGDQCIQKSFHCDGQFDCQDKSDEIGCSPPTITQSPQEVVNAMEGETVNITCRAIGNPVPLINWRLNGGHIPPKPRVSTTSENGFGVVTIRDVRQSDQGAWSCEAINRKQSVLATPHAILVVETTVGYELEVRPNVSLSATTSTVPEALAEAMPKSSSPTPSRCHASTLVLHLLRGQAARMARILERCFATGIY